MGAKARGTAPPPPVPNPSPVAARRSGGALLTVAAPGTCFVNGVQILCFQSVTAVQARYRDNGEPAPPAAWTEAEVERAKAGGGIPAL